MANHGHAPRRWYARPVTGNPALAAPVRVPVAVIAGLAAALCTALAVLYGGHAEPSQVDIVFQRLATDLVAEPGVVVYLIDFVGEPLGALGCVGAVALVCWTLRRRRLAVVAVVSLGAAGTATTALKPLVGRKIHGEFLAYPSGHTATATVLAFVLVLLLIDLARPPRVVRVVLLVCGTGTGAAIMAFAQVNLGAHYPTDTVGGFCVGLVVVSVTAYLTDQWSGIGRRRGVGST